MNKNSFSTIGWLILSALLFQVASAQEPPKGEPDAERLQRARQIVRLFEEGKRDEAKAILEDVLEAAQRRAPSEPPEPPPPSKEEQRFLVELETKLAVDPELDKESALREAAEKGYLSVVEFLCRQKADLNAADPKTGDTALHLAVAGEKLAVARYLAAQGANLESKNKAGKTPLDLAADKSIMLHLDLQSSAVAGEVRDELRFVTASTPASEQETWVFNTIRQQLKEGKAKDLRNLLLTAAGNNYTAVVEVLLREGTSPVVKTESGETPLHLAVGHANVAMCRALLVAKAPLDVQTSDGSTPLHLAASQGNRELVEMLLGFGAKPDVQNLDGDTPLHLAVRGKHEKALVVLLLLGAKPDVRNVSGQVPADVTADADVRRLLAHAARQPLGEMISKRRDGRTPPDATKADLAALQGTWEATSTDANGNIARRLVKEVRGNHEKVTIYGARGELTVSKENDFSLEIKGEDRVFRFFNGRVLAPPQIRGRTFEGQYVYRIEDDRFIEIARQPGSTEKPSYTLVWTRRR